MSKQRLLGFIDSLERLTRKFVWKTAQTEWRDYYDQTNYSDAAFEEKKQVVRSFIDRFKPESIWDLGANTGEFSRVVKGNAARIVSFDVDSAAVEMNYLRVKKEGETHILPLIQDLTNPSPGIGWMHQERESLMQRGSADMCLALALIHHLAISNNVPLSEIARLFSSMASYLIIEFVPKEDSQVKRLLATRKDIFSDYHKEGFERAFLNYYRIITSKQLSESHRTLYLMEKIQD